MPPLNDFLTSAFLFQMLVVAVAGFVRGFSGFGAALVMAPGLALVLDTVDAVGMVILLNAATALQMLPTALRLTRWRDMGPMLVAACLALPFGGYLLAAVDGAVVRRAIGLVVVVFAAVLLTGWRYPGQRRLPATLGVGVLSGLLTGAAGIGGPPVVLYLLSGDRPMAENRAGFISFFGLSQLVALPMFFLYGFVGGASLWPLLVLVPVYMLATHLGSRLFSRANERLYRWMALGFMAAVGIATLVL